MRKPLLVAGVLLTSLTVALTWGPAAHTPPTITVYKSPTCSCCKSWVDQVRAAGFVVVVRDTNDMASVKQTLKVPEKLLACHTAVVDGYLIEGHVPPDLITQLLADKPHLRGLAVPGMPMRAMMGDSMGPAFDVVSFDDSGKTKVVAHR